MSANPLPFGVERGYINIQKHNLLKIDGISRYAQKIHDCQPPTLHVCGFGGGLIYVIFC